MLNELWQNICTISDTLATRWQHVAYQVKKLKCLKMIPLSLDIIIISINLIIRIYGAFETLNDLSTKHKSKNGKTTFETGQQPASFEIIQVSDKYSEGYTKVMGRWYPYHKVQAGREQHDITTYKHEGLDSANVFMRTVLQLIIRKSNIIITIQNWNVSFCII